MRQFTLLRDTDTIKYWNDIGELINTFSEDVHKITIEACSLVKMEMLIKIDGQWVYDVSNIKGNDAIDIRKKLHEWSEGTKNNNSPLYLVPMNLVPMNGVYWTCCIAIKEEK